MQITISTKAVLSTVGTLLLGAISWAALSIIDHGASIRALQTSSQADARQDSELTELRATVRDLIRLTASLDGSPVPAGPARDSDAPDSSSDDPAAVEAPKRANYEAFRMEQADLETILRGRGLKPTKKPLSDS